MKTNQEIIKAVEEAKIVVQTIYKYDERMLNQKSYEQNSGVAEESKIVFTEVLKYLLNN